MDVNTGLVCNLIGSFLFLILSLLLLINWRGQLVGGLLLLSGVISTVWFTASAYYYAIDLPTASVPVVLEILRDSAWLLFLYVVLKQRPDAGQSFRFSYFLPGLLIAIAGSLFALILTGSVNAEFNIAGINGINLLLIGFFVLSLIGLLLIEKFYRSVKPEKLWAIKFLCLGVGGIFMYDFFLYSEALLYKVINPDLYAIRGLINSLCVPLIAVSIARNPEWKMDLFVSRHIIYRSTATMAAGIYLILMAVVGYYLHNLGGSYGRSLQVLFFFGALMLLMILLFSEQLRTELKVFIAKHFYRNKYDYREEWLKITDTLSDFTHEENIYRTIIKAVANTINTTTGELWLLDQEEKEYVLRETIGSYDLLPDEIRSDSPFIVFMREKQWVINIDEYRNRPDRYDNIGLPDSMLMKHNAWLIVPLINGDVLVGFMILARPYANISFNWEDVDLLKTIGKQIAGYLALLRVSEQLSEAKQFEAFNHLSAFVVHDIKNMVAQLSLISNNAKKYRDNPEFIDDALDTIDNTVNKMLRLLDNLKKERTFGSYSRYIDMNDLLREVIEKRKIEQPVPVLQHSDENLIVSADRDSLLSVMEHLVQNAQEATNGNGKVEIGLEHNRDTIRIIIRDDGCGMDDNFIRNRLFKPFETTKGNAGMGIGVYESRELIHKMNGTIDVKSKPGAGTAFTVSLPLAKQEQQQAN